MTLIKGKRYYTTFSNKRTVLFVDYDEEYKNDNQSISGIYNGKLILFSKDQIVKAK